MTTMKSSKSFTNVDDDSIVCPTCGNERALQKLCSLQQLSSSAEPKFCGVEDDEEEVQNEVREGREDLRARDPGAAGQSGKASRRRLIADSSRGPHVIMHTFCRPSRCAGAGSITVTVTFDCF